MRMTPKTTQAKDYVAAPTGVQNQGEMGDIGQQEERTMRSTGPASESLDKMNLTKISDQPMDQEWMDMMAFMNEPVEIQIAETPDESAAPVFEININGRLELFRRGETKTVPRFFVDRLLRMKETRYTQKEIVNGEGIRDMVQIPRTVLKYDFAITKDANRLSRDWQRAVRAEVG